MKIGFIGCGNMGGAMALAAAGRGTLLLANRTRAKAETLAARCGGTVATNEEAAACEMVVLGVKPQMLAGVISPLKEILKEKKPIVVCMAAGITLEKLTALCGAELPMIRMMPNMPAQVGAGLILYAAARTTEAQEKAVLEAFEKAGEWIPLEESMMDAATAVAGCGPAFAYLFTEALADGGVACGLPRALAQRLAAGTVRGSAEMVLKTGAHPAELKDAVCSPGGSTIEGVAALEEGGFRAAASEAVRRAYHKTKKLGDGEKK